MANRFANFGVILDGLNAGEQRRDAMARHRISIRSQEKMQRAKLRADEERYEKESAYRRERDAIEDQAAQDAIIRAEEAAMRAQANADREFNLKEKKYNDSKEALALQMEKDRLSLNQAYYNYGVQRAKDEEEARKLQEQKDNEEWLQAAGYTLYNAKNNVDFFAHDVDGDGKISEAEKRLECKVYSPEHLKVLGRIANKLTGGVIKNVDQAYHFIDGSLMVRDANTGETETIMNGNDVYKLFSQLSGSSSDLVNKTGDMFKLYYNAEVKENERRQFIENSNKIAFDADYISRLHSMIKDYDKIILDAQNSQESILAGKQDSVREIFGLESNYVNKLIETRDNLQKELDRINSSRYGYPTPTNSGAEEQKEEAIGKPTNVPPPNSKYKAFAFTNENGETIFKVGLNPEDAAKSKEKFYSKEEAIAYANGNVDAARKREEELKRGLYNTESAVDKAELHRANLTDEEYKLLTETPRSILEPVEFDLNGASKVASLNINNNEQLISLKVIPSYTNKSGNGHYKFRKRHGIDKVSERYREILNNDRKSDYYMNLPDYIFSDKETQKRYNDVVVPLSNSGDEKDLELARKDFDKIKKYGMSKDQFLYEVNRAQIIKAYKASQDVKERADLIKLLTVLNEEYNKQ
jgi:hypothetical protein